MSDIITDRELASRIYDLDTKVYQATGSSLGKTLPAEKEASINQLIHLMKTNKDKILKQEMILNAPIPIKLSQKNILSWKKL